MKGKLGLLVCLLSVISLYSVGTALFWIAIGNTILNVGTSFAYSFIIARPSIRKYEEALKEKIESGASEAAIDALESFPIEQNDTVGPKWLLVILWLTFLFSICLLIIGLINWVK